MRPENRFSERETETKPTRPSGGLEHFQQIHISKPHEVPYPHPPSNIKLQPYIPQQYHSVPRNHCCFGVLLPVLAVLSLLIYLFLPFHTNILILGVDGGLNRGEVGRTDTIVLTTISPLMPYVGLLSIPRDLWVSIPGVGENRINTAYFYAENEKRGSGLSAIKKTIHENFGVSTDYAVVLRMDGLIDVVDAFNGLDITLVEPISGYDAGKHHFDGKKALAFARSRAGSDDFARMKQGQILLQAVFRKMLKPSTWPLLPEILASLPKFLETNIPIWQWPRLGLAVIRTGPSGVDSRTITREMVNPFLTSGGAQVLLPDWEKINTVTKEMFGKKW